ncbi:MAG TPA: branched-chain amino acid ABC transporter substrate-binding protein [Burkholderiales bacterium]|nr:branched-chain amino acid ABC transporter substrate-binding protein [Burkholderiales bacterium]
MKSSANPYLFGIALLMQLGSAWAADIIKIAVVETLSGPPAVIGKWWSNHVQMAVDQVNAKGGILGGRKIETVAFDTKASPQEALVAFKAVTDQEIRFVFGTTGSHVALALTDAIAKHNARNPENSVLFLNYGGLTPEMTNEKCNFWHFRFDAHADMKVDALIRQVVGQKSITKVYLVNQDYAYGQAVRKLFRELLAQRRPDIEIVGDDLIQLQKVKDFSPYIAKIRASAADTVLTSNWGPDLVLLMRASHDSGLPARYYTLNAHFTGTPTAIGEAGVGRLINVSPWHANIADGRLEQYYVEYKKQYREEWNMLPHKNAVEMWAKAVDTTKSLDPIVVAKALEGMRYDSGTGMMWMRAEDHQLMQPQYAYMFTKLGPGVKHDIENTGFGWRTEGRTETDETVPPTTCKMERPPM